MALMTSCPACSTRFKVVPDQLRLHHGLVRCGACSHVFDANTHLEVIIDEPTPFIDLIEEPSADSWYNKPAAQALVNASGQARSTADDPQWTQMQPQSIAQNTSIKPPSATKRRANTHPSRGEMSSQNAGGELKLTRRSLNIEQLNALAGKFQSSERYREIDADDLAAMQAAEQQHERRKRRAEKKRAQVQAEIDAQASLSLDDKEHFETGENLHHTEPELPRQPSTALWHSIGRLLTVVISVLAGLAAGLQLLLMGRFALADALPSIKPLLSQVCTYAGCSIEPAAWLQPLSLDALTLSTPSKQSGAPDLGSGLQSYRIQATVRNNSQLAVKKPDIELTISNVQGAVIARKTIAANSFVAQPFETTIKPGMDWLIDAVVLLDEQTVGYTARLVYLP